MNPHSAAFGPNSGYVEELYNLYLIDPSLVGESWANYFNSNGFASPASMKSVRNINEARPAVRAETNGAPAVVTSLELQERASALIDAYRRHGHLLAVTNPLRRGVISPRANEDLDINLYGFSGKELKERVRCSDLAGHKELPVEQLVPTLQNIYCGTVGFEYAHLQNRAEREWLREQIEKRGRPTASTEEKKARLQKLIEAEGLESELHKKYVGVKRFSLEGGEALIPAIDAALEVASRDGVREVIFGMAHRGRINVLANTLKKPLDKIFCEFEDKTLATVLGAGDVKYHMGHTSTHRTRNGGELKLMLAYNPSHLEFVNPVVEGMARARQDLAFAGDRRSVLPFLIHGDAAVIGQGVVPETLQLSEVAGFDTGGSIHIAINNQIGFTTTADEARTSTYCTDVAKLVDAPVFHVNGEDVDGVCWVTELATEFRNRFGRDVFIDIVCWRKYGHNEGDEPLFTQPVMYGEIKEKRTVTAQYAERVVGGGSLSQDEVKSLTAEFKGRFDAARELAEKVTLDELKKRAEAVTVLHRNSNVPQVSRETLGKVAATLTNFPADFRPHAKLKAMLEKRVQALKSGSGVEWGFAENLAFGSLLLEGVNVRLSGQDCCRGTFSHRHMALDDAEGRQVYVPFKTLPTDATFEVYNSILSEVAVMAYEFGYSSEAPKSLVLWEGQYGDFANGAQVIIDQFIASSEVKWGQLSGIVLLLPHGYEGGGPEHSSARLERYLQLSAENNWTVCNPTSAASYYHMLRKQGHAEHKRPLVVMTPKSLLRFPDAAATVDELVEGSFQPVLTTKVGEGSGRNVILCSGKVYYDVVAGLSAAGVGDALVLRLEQLYPFPDVEIKAAIGGATPERVIWVQEEHENMGAYSYVAPKLRALLGKEVRYAGRAEAATTATGSPKRHAEEQKALIGEMVNYLK